jgi:hypothetical protein
MKVWDTPQIYRTVATGIGLFFGFLAMLSMNTGLGPKMAVFILIYCGALCAAYLVWRAQQRRHPV